MTSGTTWPESVYGSDVTTDAPDVVLVPMRPSAHDGDPSPSSTAIPVVAEEAEEVPPNDPSSHRSRGGSAEMDGVASPGFDLGLLLGADHVNDGVDEREVGEGLREVAEVAAAAGIELFGVQVE